MIVWDIETGPQPREKLIDQAPTEADIKFGNTKDKEKRAAKIEEEVAKFFEKAALEATTGQVLAIGFMFEGDDGGIGEAIYYRAKSVDERWMISEFWRYTSLEKGPLVCHNCHGFDLPFLVRRSWLLGIDVPDWVLVDGRYWSPKFVDTMKIWSFGTYGEFVKLESISKALGLGGKTEGVTGADFARLLETDRELAIEYLKCDLRLTWGVAEALQIV
jgi:hypothetical protein